jgi:hypothetical protein
MIAVLMLRGGGGQGLEGVASASSVEGVGAMVAGRLGAKGGGEKVE